MQQPTGSDRRTVLVIWAAILAGSIIFLGVLAYVRALGGFTQPVAELLPWLGLALPVLLVAAAAVVPGRIPAAGPPEGVARTRLVLGWALREGGAAIGGVMWLLSGDAKALAGAAIAITALAAAMPTEERWRAEVEAAGGERQRTRMVR